ncbi:hypothetical protein GCM10009578_065580 [Streptomyces rhizosphaericus]
MSADMLHHGQRTPVVGRAKAPLRWGRFLGEPDESGLAPGPQALSGDSGERGDVGAAQALPVLLHTRRDDGRAARASGERLA